MLSIPKNPFALEIIYNKTAAACFRNLQLTRTLFTLPLIFSTVPTVAVPPPLYLTCSCGLHFENDRAVFALAAFM
jgi:hypothetical protein